MSLGRDAAFKTLMGLGFSETWPKDPKRGCCLALLKGSRGTTICFFLVSFLQIPGDVVFGCAQRPHFVMFQKDCLKQIQWTRWKTCFWCCCKQRGHAPGPCFRVERKKTTLTGLTPKKQNGWKRLKPKHPQRPNLSHRHLQWPQKREKQIKPRRKERQRG